MGEHDAFFKRAFSVPEHAGGELRSVLPEEVVSAMDLSTLELVPGTFVDPELAERYTDLLFRARLDASSSFVYVYFLIEHQSEPDALMPFRVLVYAGRASWSWCAIYSGS